MYKLVYVYISILYWLIIGNVVINKTYLGCTVIWMKYGFEIKKKQISFAQSVANIIINSDFGRLAVW